jgi:hypothetical protein
MVLFCCIHTSHICFSYAGSAIVHIVEHWCKRY